MTTPTAPATDAEIAHGRITLDEMYHCGDDCPASDGKGRCFRCSIHPAILAHIDALKARLDQSEEMLKESAAVIGGLKGALSAAIYVPDATTKLLAEMRDSLDVAKDFLARFESMTKGGKRG